LANRQRRFGVGRLGFDRPEIVRVLDDVLLDLAEIVDHLGQLRPGLAQPVHEMADREAGQFLVERLDPLAPLALPLRHELHQRLELALEPGDRGLDAFLMFFGQLPERLGAHHFALVNRREGESGLRPDQRGLARVGGLLEVVERGLLEGFEFVLDGVLAGDVVLALEHRRDRRPQVAYQAFHVTAQAHAPARRQAQRARLVRLGEIVDVAPVRRRRLAGRPFLDIAPNQRHLAGSLGPERE
jgi:hypothetical protein